jgi:hypothetical protein
MPIYKQRATGSIGLSLELFDLPPMACHHTKMRAIIEASDRTERKPGERGS